MKKYFLSLTIITIFLFLLQSCKKSFLTKLPEDSITIENFPATESGVASVTGVLYNKPWFGFHDKLLFAISEMGGGNLRTFDPYWSSYVTLAVGSEDKGLAEGWRSLYNVIATSNELIKNIEAKKLLAPGNDAILDAGIGEAKFMRAFAYFYLARLFGEVPLFTDAVPFIESNTNIPKHKLPDVFKFIERDLLDAETKLPLRSARSLKRRVSKGSAQTLLAKVYLYQKKYADAKTKSFEVIQSGEYGLMGLDFATDKGYANLFILKDAVDDMNKESICTLNWGFRSTGDLWGIQNTLQAYLAIAPLSPDDGWGGGTNPTIDLLEKYSPSDKRRNPTVMTANATYPDMIKKGESFTYTQDLANQSATGANVKKQVIGTAAANGLDNVTFMCTTFPTYLLRCSDLYLIYSESVMGGANGASLSLSSATTDASALQYFNAVRQRAGLSPKMNITLKDIIDERRLELAMEFDYIFDLGRLQTSEWQGIIGTQKRGERDATTGVYRPLVFPMPSKLTFTIPAGELVKNPKLSEPAIDFQF